MSRLRTMLRQMSDLGHRVTQTLFSSCDHVSELSSKRLDGNLSARGRIRRRVHLSVCAFCRRYARQLRFIRNQTRQLGNDFEEKAPEKLTAESKARMTGALEKEIRKNS